MSSPFKIVASQSPKPPPKSYLETRSAHNVRQWINQAVKERRLKDCWNLYISIVEPRIETHGRVTDAGDSFFIPTCKHQSFESQFAHLTDDQQSEVLRHSLCIDPVSCPKNCTYYENHRWGWTKSTAKRLFVGIYDAIKAVLKGYAALPWQTQVAILAVPVLLVILRKSPNWLSPMLSLLKAIWGKTP